MSRELITLCIDACRGRVKAYAAENAAYTDDAIRQAFKEIIGGETLTYQAWRRHKIEVFEIIEEVLNTNLPDAWNLSPFYNELVEVKNGSLGDKNEYTVEDHSMLVVSKFSGNHWNTDRQKLIGKKAFTLDTEWFYIRVYDELERFLKGTVTIAEMFARLQTSFQRDFDSRVYSAFTSAPVYLPGKFIESGSLTKDNLTRLIDRVETANGKPARIVSTKVGLAKLDALVPSQWISDAMRDEKHTTGLLRVWDGHQTLVIPQCFTFGTYDFRISDTTVLVLPADYKPIKFYFEGDTRSREYGHEDTQDMTIDVQLQTKAGIGVVFSNLFGQYNVTA